MSTNKPDSATKSKTLTDEFLKVYNDQESFLAEDLRQYIQNFKDNIKNVDSIPRKDDLIRKSSFEIFTIPEFISSAFNHDSQAFYESCLAFFQFCAYLYAGIRKNFTFQGYDQIKTELQSEWPECKPALLGFKSLMEAAFGLASKDDTIISSKYIPENISFLTDYILLNILLSQNVAYQQILEVTGEIFVFQAIRESRDQIFSFENQEKLATPKEFDFNPTLNNYQTIQPHSNDFQIYLSLIEYISALRQSDDFALLYTEVGEEYLHFTSDPSPQFFIQLLRTLSALTKNESIAERILSHLKNSSSNIINFQHISESIFINASNVSQPNSIKVLTEIETMALESILSLFTAMCKYSSSCRMEIGNLNYNDMNTIDALFTLIHYRVPATLKAKCFDLLGTFAVEKEKCAIFWQTLINSQLLTEEMVERKSGGLLQDFESEKVERYYPLTRAFVRFLTSLLYILAPPADTSNSFNTSSSYLSSSNDNNSFLRFHNFIMQCILFDLSTFQYDHPHEKWALISEITQCWANYANYGVSIAKPLYRSFFCDLRLNKILLDLCTTDDIPYETLLCIFKLFLTAYEYQKEFQITMDMEERSSFLDLSEQFSSTSGAIIKLIQCIGARDLDLQRVSISLAYAIAAETQTKVQLVFCQKTAHAIRSIKKLLLSNNPNRTILVKFLKGLGSSSKFLMYTFGYDITNPPTSIYESKLDNGITYSLLQALAQYEPGSLDNDINRFTNPYNIKELNTEFADEANEDGFVENILRLLLLLTDHYLCATPLLNAMRSAPAQYDLFAANFPIIAEKSRTAVGLFLQILAREANNSSNIPTASKSTFVTFKSLFSYSSSAPPFILSLIEKPKIEYNDDENDEERRRTEMQGDIEIGKGVYDCCLSFLTNKHIEENYLSKSKTQEAKNLQSVFLQLIDKILSNLLLYQSDEAASYLTNSLSFIIQSSFVKEAFQKPQQKKDLFSNILLCLDSGMKSEPSVSLGLFSSINSLFSQTNQPNLSEFHLEVDEIVKIASAIDEAMSIGSPINQAAAISTAENLIQYFPVDITEELLLKTLDRLHNDWVEFDRGTNLEGTCFVLRTKFSLFLRAIFITPFNNLNSNTNKLKNGISSKYGSFLLSNGLLTTISHIEFWESLPDAFSTPLILDSDEKLKTMSKALQLITALCSKCESSELIQSESKQLFYKFWHTLKGSLSYFHFLTNALLQLILQIVNFIAVSPWLLQDEDVKGPLRSLLNNVLNNSTQLINLFRDEPNNNAGQLPTTNGSNQMMAVVGSLKTRIQILLQIEH